MRRKRLQLDELLIPFARHIDGRLLSASPYRKGRASLSGDANSWAFHRDSWDRPPEKTSAASVASKAFEMLSDRQQLLVSAIVLEGQSPAEVARDLGIHRANVGRAFQNALAGLRTAYLKLAIPRGDCVSNPG